LIIHFKRFEINGSGYGFKKINKTIKYDVNSFNMYDFCANVQKEAPIYDLYGIVHHEGNMAFGHYYAFAKNEDNKQWYNFNDRNVSHIQNHDYL